jgi:hypothetical protein
VSFVFLFLYLFYFIAPWSCFLTQQNEDAGSQVQLEKPEEAPRVIRMTPNQEEATEPEES